MKVKVLVAPSYPTLCDPVDCNPPGSSVHRILHARILKWVSHSLLQGIFLTQGLNTGLPHGRQILYHLSHEGSPKYRKVKETGFIKFSPESIYLKTCSTCFPRAQSAFFLIFTLNSFQGVKVSNCCS